MSSEAAAKTSESPSPSCESCRKRKLRCTRQYPTCANCEKFEVLCVYDSERKKPGFKVGVVDSLNRRLEAVELALAVSQQQSTPQVATSSPNVGTHAPSIPDVHQYLTPLVGVMSTLTDELHSLSSALASSQHKALDVPSSHNIDGQPRKRRRTDNAHTKNTERYTNTSGIANLSASTCSVAESIDALSDEILEAYFQYIQPWISILHEPSIRKHGFKDSSSPLNQAIKFAAIRFVKRGEQGLPPGFISDSRTRARSNVLASATDSLCVENVQALLILTYMELIDHHMEKAISLIGIISHQITAMQLYRERATTQSSNDNSGTRQILVPNENWIDEEEERRAFWNAIMLDRFCAVITGCQPSITGPNIKRRLPVCASYWFTNQKYQTPYMQVSDVLRATLSQPIPLPRSASKSTGSTPDVYDADVSDSSGIGALAFYMETVESMSMVVGLFLHQSIDLEVRNDVFQWLTRFKELDAYLIWWKMHLPQQWADSGVSRRLMPGIIDPAMAAANATHNTCLILLHSEIAYPDPKLHWIQLPSSCSADICVNAAVEVCTILTRFVAQRPVQFPLSPQLGLCAFVSARSLLLNWRCTSTPLSPEFWLLVQSLDDMGRRSEPFILPNETHTTNLFHHFADRLRSMQAQCELEPSFQIDRQEAICEISHSSTRSYPRHWMTPSELVAYMERPDLGLKLVETMQAPIHQNNPLSEVARGIDDAQVTDDTQRCMPWVHGDLNETLLPGDNLMAISETLMGPGFTDLDRIVSFDEMMMSGIAEAPTNWDFM